MTIHIASMWHRWLMVTLTALLVSACAQQAVVLERSFWSDKGQRVGVVMSVLPDPKAHSAGDGGWLSFVLAEQVGAGSSAALSRIDVKRLEEGKSAIARVLSAKGMKPVVLEQPVDLSSLPSLAERSGYAKWDFSAFGKRLDVDVLVAISVDAVGSKVIVDRLPISQPYGYSSVTGQIIDLRSQRLLWHKQTRVTRAVRGEWNQPPHFPNLENAALSAMSASIDLMVADFSWFAR